MASEGRRERERAIRERLIIAAARELAESQGWEAVTTRRLAERVEYSQPVLYSHFKSKDAIMAAVALEGFADLASALEQAHRDAAPGTGRTTLEGLTAVAKAYLDFAAHRPALYDTMFSQHLDLPFAADNTPEPLKAGFNALAAALAPFAAADDLGLLTETLWAALHGLITLTRGNRLPPELQDRRLVILLTRLTK
ncbi:TetR/AcrR family transcriptional regulator [Dactylosporangium matsuzakiense]|uniref:TetR family transcriptional regulator n=1 Tax=Dactylosporangium matsuzakiense TaxID=53360 RepID=A0A9W6NQI5_9ACTN|nr:TetR/AcrR family transcriptional regulator [Dactylosporangium matsuzakiense]UWZ47634.1 helix-turn-helix transcriptional regulator [Dactylosporangium matsuzakiense]GLL05579.1 TetR family transcriptional regulator [Dactylosporangium matsuzakiense]